MCIIYCHKLMSAQQTPEETKLMYQSLFLFALLVRLSTTSTTQSLSSTKFMDCSLTTIACGGFKLNISYPFRKPGMPAYCGRPEFQVSCTEDHSKMTVPMIGIAGKEYHVQSINYNTQLIGVSDIGYSADTCPVSITNITFDPSLFYYSTNCVNLTVYFNCTFMATVPPNLKNIPCLENNSTGYSSYFAIPGDSQPEVPEKCSSIVAIRMYTNGVHPFVKGRIDFLGVLQDGFGLQWTVGKEWCGWCEASGGVCGFDSNSTDAQICFCPDGRTADGTCTQEHTKKVKKTAVDIVGGTMALVTACCIVICCYYGIYRKKSLNNDQNVENFLKKHGSLAPKRYKYSDVKKIAESFRNKLGQGGYGSVFKGTLSDGRLVAVKVLSDSKGNGEDFFNEIASIGRSSHVNIVNLLGFCSEGSKRALIYEYMCNGSLDKLICSEEPKTTLRWEQLYQIATGIARGLEYLHRGCNTRIVHFDIKPHNILLDQDLCPKISDFGLSKLCLRKDSIISMEGTRGTIGYIAPEVFSRNFGVVSTKSDIYSYGMMVLEMVGGRENIPLDVQNTSENYFPYSIYKHLDHSAGLEAYGATAGTEEVVRKMILVGLWCIQTMPQNRPSITKVIEMLEGSIDDLQVPPKPNLSFPSFGPVTDISSGHDTCSIVWL